MTCKNQSYIIYKDSIKLLFTYNIIIFYFCIIHYFLFTVIFFIFYFSLFSILDESNFLLFSK